MADMTQFHKTLTEIEETRSFERLETFKHPSVWNSMLQDERLLLSRLLVMHGAHQLAKGEDQVLESFENAAKISSYAPEVLFQQGVVLSAYRDNIRCLTLACHILTSLSNTHPSFLEGWTLRGQVLTDIGLFEGEASYFSEANQSYEKASKLLGHASESFKKDEFYWNWGICLSSLGKSSGEPLDFHKAIEKYRLAYDLDCKNATFLNDFGNCYADLGALLEKSEHFTEALNLFQQAVSYNPKCFEAWFNQACCTRCLIEFTFDEKLLEAGETSFLNAAELNPQCSQLWLKWGQFEMAVGKIKHDRQKLESSLEKFAQAYRLEPEHPKILSYWAEATLFVGAQDERIDLLHSARAKIMKSLEIQPEDPHTWYLYGSCLNEIGKYFNDEVYYHQAIEKFHHGISLSRFYPLFWYGLALSHIAVGDLIEEQASFEKAVRCCAKVIEYGGGGFAQFWNDWGVALLKLAEFSQQATHIQMAIEKFEHALKHPVRNLDGEDVDLEWVYNYGSAYDLLGDLTEESAYFEKAVQILTQVIQVDPENNQARYNLALALSHLGEALFDVEVYSKAIEHFECLLDQDPEDDMIHLDFGMSLTNLALLVHDNNHMERSYSLYQKAESHFMQAALLGNTQSYYQLAGLYSITKQFQGAMNYLAKAQSCGTLPGIEDLLHDDWLEELRQTPSFREFINELSSQQSMDDK